MCGIVGYIGGRTALPFLVDGLKRLEYRGYDSAGIATVGESGLELVRAKGKLHNLEEKLNGVAQSTGTVGIGHTRWATHGKPEEHNAHPHTDASGRLAVIQNGIIENYAELRLGLKERGCLFKSETDTEVIPHLIACRLAGHSLLEAVLAAVVELKGAFAIAVVSADFPDELIVVRQQAPLVIGFGEGENYFASDVPAIVSHTTRVLTLQDGECARLTRDEVQIHDFSGARLRRTPRSLNWNPSLVEKRGFRHFMLKEIHEQPGVIRDTLEDRIGDATGPIRLGLSSDLFADLERIYIIACGTSWHASLVGKYLIEELAGIPTEVNYASEFRYCPPPLNARTLVIGVSQSGETGDTNAALTAAKARGVRLLGITNRPESSLGALVGELIDTRAGMEIGVAATKTFTAQLVAFYLLALHLAHLRGTQSGERIREILVGLQQLPAQIEGILDTQERYITELAREFDATRDFIFIGRGLNYPIALEGALKLKEISYIHAEGYPAGEMKHGPIALLDSEVPVVAIAVPGKVYEKTLSNAQEAKARDARLIGVAPLDEPAAVETFDQILPVPVVDEILSPILTVVPLQLLAYHIAARRGLDVDQPRNLAKSVTVE
ncbi:glutamine--fructose-6-phosphate transaminase (isomerizing) [Gloeobacter violaceus]|uniref:Glutamine--fructose-6-phosphate aminotransferase [isomerizing] n=1 Tax=Gloeobacter violaceus (strain ATCC 29082 / PCC 7421) TaxID=251221 RepID=GLMS_GLOVI|nr:glutamine--fructose-6-phosphate transaminase (isomerizing) [Gloeobacter violaceus]Q7NIG8.3 RecName: Full=Glutamine--fructose-6-phosphate aminotransferase [isomerizing]; AltName: Full=D-fructose-6-phosphate amidotransferase; AltName: Full=GFAT; AltName: Full=Glucosamine-6-phosphate synthase; AltName: Full=Hexosephosphate aminotransferase; AltName: Full=L-glutamine--D-fructose-6-phosphate amidotransferase [Gloeobacter violaceus PCC 7421]BAC90156.1 glutamine-fructose-6-P-aminotransferase [Gloeoba